MPSGPVTLAGYSMGGRIALQLALAEPGRIERLVLISATAGIEDEGERSARQADDEQLAAHVEGWPIEEFADAWMAHEIFVGTPAEAQRLWREDLLRNDPHTVAAQLRAFGAGAMEPMWSQLGTLTMPVDVVVGERDEKYVGLGERLVEALPNAQLTVVAGAGHGVPREQPQALAALLRADQAPSAPR